jgi:hypothetical protein
VSAMTRSRSLEFTFWEASAGWLPVSVRVAAHREDLEASDVLNDGRVVALSDVRSCLVVT